MSVLPNQVKMRAVAVPRTQARSERRVEVYAARVRRRALMQVRLLPLAIGGER